MKSAKALIRLLDYPSHAVYIRDIRVHIHNFGAEFSILSIVRFVRTGSSTGCLRSTCPRILCSAARTPDQHESGFIVLRRGTAEIAMPISPSPPVIR